MRLIGHHSTLKDTGRGGAAENAHGRMRPADVGWTCRMYGHLMGGSEREKLRCTVCGHADCAGGNVSANVVQQVITPKVLAEKRNDSKTHEMGQTQNLTRLARTFLDAVRWHETQT